MNREKRMNSRLKLYPKVALFLIMAIFTVSQMAAADSKKLILGNEGTYPPFSMIGTDDRLTGFEPELAREMCKRLGVEFEIQAMEFKALLPSLISGKIDMIVSQLYPKPERLEKTEFTIPILFNPQEYIVPRNWNTGTDAKALDGKRIGVMRGSWYIEPLKAHAPGVKLVSYDNEGQIKLDLLAGRLDLAYGARIGWTIRILDQEGGDNWKLLPSDFVLESKKEEFSWAVQKGDIELRDKVNAVLEEMFQDCTYTKIRKQFFSQPLSDREPETCQ